MGPTTLFDKSFIQNLKLDEAVLFDHFFMCNIAPPFLVETLADLEKGLVRGRPAEDEVRSIAERTPENGNPGVNTFFRQGVGASLIGLPVPMVGQLYTSHGKKVSVDGKTSTVVGETPEGAAFRRWQEMKFQEVERMVAAKWRAILEAPPSARAASLVERLGLNFEKTRSGPELKQLVDNALEGHTPTIKLLEVCFELYDIGEPFCSKVRGRLAAVRYIPLRWFAPYAAHVLSVDLVFYIGMKLGLISAADPHTKTDFAYLYYLPFCSVFVSSDKIHRTWAPLFMRKDQSFVWGVELKAALAELHNHLQSLPESEKRRGLYAIAPTPPKDIGKLVASLWSIHLAPGALDRRPAVDIPDGKADAVKAELLAHVNKMVSEAENAPEDLSIKGQTDSFIIRRMVRVKRGSYQILPQEMAD